MRDRMRLPRIPNLSDWQIFIKTLFLLPVTALLVQWMRFSELLKWLDRASVGDNAVYLEKEVAANQARRVASVFLRAVQLSPIKGRCLSQSLVLWHLLKRRGFQGQLRIGVRKKDELRSFTTHNFDAHAWVEFQGEVLNERPDVHERFTVIRYTF